MTLPAPSTIRRWLQAYKFGPGENKARQRLLKLKVETMSDKTKECVLCFDEMAIKESLDYSKANDKMEDYEDLGRFGRTSNSATEVLVFCLRGIYSTWKLPISFYFSHNSVSAEQLCKILKHTLTYLADIGLKPVSTICDQSPTNQKLFRLLNVTVDSPFIDHNGHKYFMIFDSPHLK